MVPRRATSPGNRPWGAARPAPAIQYIRPAPARFNAPYAEHSARGVGIGPTRQDGREAFFPLITELVRDPAEIWVGFAKSLVTGRVALRRRYVNVVEVGRGQSIGLAADAEQGLWVGLTFFRGRLGSLDGLRTGVRAYQRR